MLEILSILPTLTLRKAVNLLQNRLAYAISLISKRPIVWGAPSFLSLEPTNICTLQCPECPSGNGSLKREKGFLSVSMAKEVIKQQASHLSYLQLFLQGEPFLHPGLTEVIACANRANIYTSISTNAQHLSTQSTKQLLDAGLHKIIISMDGFTQDTYARYRVGGDVNKVKKVLEDLAKYKRERKSKLPFIELQCLVFRHNEHEIENLQDYAKQLPVNKFTLKKAQLYNAQSKTIWLPANKKFSRYTEQGYSKARNRACHRLWTTMVITWDGKLIPCCFDKDANYAMADVGETPTQTAWRNRQFQQFRHRVLHNRKEIPMCNNCDQ